MQRNEWTVSSGMGGHFAAEYAAVISKGFKGSSETYSTKSIERKDSRGFSGLL